MTTEQLLQNATYCIEAAKERAGDALRLVEINHTEAIEQAATAALQVAFAVERLIEAQAR